MIMSNKLLVEYIRLALAESGLARVPNQLLSPNAESEQEEDKEDGIEDVQEFSGVGAIVGYSAPLGMSSDKLGRKKNTLHKK